MSVAGVIKQSDILSNMFPGQHVACSAAIESRGHIFVRNQVVHKDSAVKILCGIHVGDVFYLLVQELHKRPDLARNSPIAHWQPKVDAFPCLQVDHIKVYARPSYYRSNDDGSISVT